MKGYTLFNRFLFNNCKFSSNDLIVYGTRDLPSMIFFFRFPEVPFLTVFSHLVRKLIKRKGFPTLKTESGFPGLDKTDLHQDNPN